MMVQASADMMPQKNVEESSDEKVNIPDTFDDSDAESDTLSEKLRKIDAYNGDGQGGPK